MGATRSDTAAREALATSVVVVVIALFLTACGGGDTTATTTEPATMPTTVTTAPTTPTAPVVGPTTPSAGSTTTISPPTPTTSETSTAPSAADALVAFFAAAEELDTEIAAAADVFNADFDPATGRLSDDARSAVRALRGRPAAAAELVPAGMSTDLETAVLAVFADLDSRVAALAGAEARLPSEATEDVSTEFALECLPNGSRSAARFTDDLGRAVAMAAGEPVPDAAPDSEEAGILAVRIEMIRLVDVGCDACGGAQYDEPVPVDWDASTVADGVDFTATFESGRWVIEITAC